MKRTISILLLISMLSAFACGSDSGDAETTGTTTAVVSDETTTSVEEVVTLPDYELDLGGEDFTILYFDPVKDWGWNSNTPSDVDAEETNGEALNDAVFNRNRKIEEMYNLTIQAVAAEGNIHSQLEKSVLSNSGEYDAALLIQQGMEKPVAEGYIVQLDDLFNFDDPWWDKNSLEGLQILGKTYAIAGDITFYDKLIALGVFFNKNMAEDYGLGDIYQLVIDGDWTFEKMLEMGEMVSADVNGDSIYDKNDRYGFSGQNDAVYELLQSAGERFCTIGDDGIPYLTVDSERAVNILVEIYTFMNNKAQFFNRGSMSIADAINMFMSNQVLFLMRPLSSLFDLRAMDAEFGIIPTPKMDTTQTQYYTSIGFTGAPLVTIPIDAKSVENSAKVLDTLSAESYLSVNDAFYDLVLGTKLTRDENSTENLDLILENRIYDPGCIFGFGDMANAFMKPGNPDTVASTIESYRSKVQADIDALVEAISD